MSSAEHPDDTASYEPGTDDDQRRILIPGLAEDIGEDCRQAEGTRAYRKRRKPHFK